MPEQYQNLVLVCQNCKNDFVIESDDFSFYEKIKVPPPTFCPECRMIRRMMWRNERSLYKRKCSATGKNIISMYEDNTVFPVYDRDYWWSDNWDVSIYYLDYDFSLPFFEQFKSLFDIVPQASLNGMNLNNCNFCNFFSDSKNCFLCFGGGKNENLMYCSNQIDSKDSLDLTLGNKNELSYFNYDSFFSYDVSYSASIQNCLSSSFLLNCRNINNSFACINLSSKSNCIFNKQYSKEEYDRIISKFNTGSYQYFVSFKKEFDLFKLKHPVKYSNINNSLMCTGDNIKNSNNSKNCFDVIGVENSKYILWTGGITKDSYDCIGVGMGSELVYESVSTVFKENLVRFSVQCQHGGNDMYYSIACYGCSNIFACIGLRNKQYCIFNKQYTKEEYFAMIEKIKIHMDEMPYIDKKGNVYKYGEFFPVDIAPFTYNESIAQEYFPLNKENILKKGYSYKEEKNRDFVIDIKNSDIPDHINDIDDSIINKVLECGHMGDCDEKCTEVFKITEKELEFYKKLNLPLPRYCPNCRHYERLKYRNPIKLWHRSCMKEGCNNEFETSYSPDRPEKVYCEKRYQQAVY